MTEHFDVVIVGAGVVGASTAFHLAQRGDVSVAVLDRGEPCSGGTAKSCAIIRSHYSVPSNIDLALRSLAMFRDFKGALGDERADCGFVNSGYMIVAGPGSVADALSTNLALQTAEGAATYPVALDHARALHPLLELDDVATVGYEPESGYADPLATTQSFLRAAANKGVVVRPHTEALRLMIDGPRVVGVETSAGIIHAGQVLSAVGPWSSNLLGGIGFDLHLEVSEHLVLTLRGEAPYSAEYPIVKDLTTDNKMYFRPAADGVILAGTGDHGEPVEDADGLSDDVSPALLETQRVQIAHRVRGFAAAELVGSWTGPYDVTPDWNPVLGPAPGVEGLQLAYGFSGHGFKLAPALGGCLAQSILGEPTDVDLAPYGIERFASGALLTGAYGIGSIS